MVKGIHVRTDCTGKAEVHSVNGKWIAVLRTVALVLRKLVLSINDNLCMINV